MEIADSWLVERRAGGGASEASARVPRFRGWWGSRPVGSRRVSIECAARYVTGRAGGSEHHAVGVPAVGRAHDLPVRGGGGGSLHAYASAGQGAQEGARAASIAGDLRPEPPDLHGPALRAP